ncbi:hypothetical protein ACFOKI_05985 [Sphingomonas qilianensis]|uniref:Haemolysin activator HlyB C-terminal domain-containing protein n=1 Tax=Sphingomonas qilianensis TaxID=1736690 RepID=A0ABU9XTG4_9SPHN
MLTGAGRPLRFLIVVLGGWTGIRAAMLWPITPDIAMQQARARPVTAVPPVAFAANVPPWAPVARPTSRHAEPAGAAAHLRAASTSVAEARQTVPAPPQRQATHVPALHEPASHESGIIAGLPVAGPALAAHATRSRLFGSAWLFVRGGGNATGGIPPAQLGGSQAGLRLAYALREDRRLALAARVSSPLGNGMRELALGVEWQPTRLPLRLVAEQRIALGEGRGGPTLAAVGGVGPTPLAAGFRLEAYAQGGVIARDGGEGYADGALRVARPIATLGGVRIDLGGGSWGAAQKGTRRLDVGPSLSATLPIGPQPLRLSLDWRQRVAGNAAPGSGPVVTLGADF